MAIIICPECGASVSDKSPNCIRCGYPLIVESKVMVYGYTQAFAVNPKVEIFLDGVSVGSVKNGDLVEIPIRKSSVLEFRCAFRKNQIKVEPGKVTKIKIVWNRLTGKLIPKIVDMVSD